MNPSTVEPVLTLEPAVTLHEDTSVKSRFAMREGATHARRYNPLAIL